MDALVMADRSLAQLCMAVLTAGISSLVLSAGQIRYRRVESSSCSMRSWWILMATLFSVCHLDTRLDENADQVSCREECFLLHHGKPIPSLSAWTFWMPSANLPLPRWKD
jgi:hypothetical protein